MRWSRRSHSSTMMQSDLRPIALLPVVAKVFEGFVREWLLDSLSPTFDALQFGCLKGRSTAHALTSMLNTWQSSLDNGHSVRLLLVDFSKAFDRVNHNILFQKLLDRNVPQCLLRWLFSYLSLRQQRTRVKSKTSSWQYLNGSMPQGSLLGPLAFLVQIDDLAPGCLTQICRWYYYDRNPYLCNVCFADAEFSVHTHRLDSWERYVN